ncbi:hypothetical protein CTA1_7166 [Colletotrichum tanaceti]|uniref:Uncharacterized protein n=1 Tax=Colletotrichum tanaceti TaxID=1306861 RepID=A0A4U6X0Q5_9PEZI|nr:hypothetical protein CTA1_7166 [Colletotrichum tanaceti]
MIQLTIGRGLVLDNVVGLDADLLVVDGVGPEVVALALGLGLDGGAAVLDVVLQVGKELVGEGAGLLGAGDELADDAGGHLGRGVEDPVEDLAVAEAALGVGVLDGGALGQGLAEAQAGGLVAADADVGVSAGEVDGADLDLGGLRGRPQLGLGQAHDGGAEEELLAVLGGAVVGAGVAVADLLARVARGVEEAVDGVADGADDLLDGVGAGGGQQGDDLVRDGLVAPRAALGVEQGAVGADAGVEGGLGQHAAEPAGLAKDPAEDERLVLVVAGAGHEHVAVQGDDPVLHEGDEQVGGGVLVRGQGEVVELADVGHGRQLVELEVGDGEEHVEARGRVGGRVQVEDGDGEGRVRVGVRGEQVLPDAGGGREGRGPDRVDDDGAVGLADPDVEVGVLVVRDPLVGLGGRGASGQDGDASRELGALGLAGLGRVLLVVLVLGRGVLGVILGGLNLGGCRSGIRSGSNGRLPLLGYGRCCCCRRSLLLGDGGDGGLLVVEEALFPAGHGGHGSWCLGIAVVGLDQGRDAAGRVGALHEVSVLDGPKGGSGRRGRGIFVGGLGRRGSARFRWGFVRIGFFLGENAGFDNYCSFKDDLGRLRFQANDLRQYCKDMGSGRGGGVSRL